jgi:antitoxin component YwqK of YwqJK toxin-antitoxin module|tara:strand:- start:50 stop:1093 length:1044 start_codon:yes stop_codon:yes gene_type:complete
MGIFDSIKRKLGYDIINNNGVNEIYWDIYKVGKILKKKYYKKNGVYHGKYLHFNNYENETWVEREINYNNGIKEGLSRYYWKKHISAEGNFSNGKVTGIIKIYFRYENESKDIKLHPVVEKYADLDKGIFKVFNLEGKLLEESEIDGVEFTEGSTSSSDGCSGGIYPKRNGLCRKWFVNGKIKEKGYWRKNNTSSIYNLCHRKGEHIQYYENGKEFKIGEWVDKQPVGIHKFYYPSGKVEFEVEYVKPTNNIYDGMFPDKQKSVNEKWYNEDGSLMSANEIISKGGVDPRSKRRQEGVRISWAHKTLNQQNYAVINGIKFRRMGQEVEFYDSYYRLDYSLGHSYSIN